MKKQTGVGILEIKRYNREVGQGMRGDSVSRDPPN